MGVILESEIRKLNRLADGSWQITLNTQELPIGQIGELDSMKGLIKVYFTDKNISYEVAKLIDDQEIKGDENKKSQAQRQRAALYVLWEQKYKDKYKTFALFYDDRMEHIINQIKERLE